MRSLLPRFLAASLALFGVAAQADTIIKLVSQDTSEFLLQGATLVIPESDSPIIANWTGDGSLIIQALTASWSFQIEPPDGTLLVPDNYEEASRWPFQSLARPGLEVKGNGRACNRVRGRFVVREFEENFDGDIVKIAVDLEHHCDFAEVAFFAMIRVNSDIPLDVPEPTAAAGRDRIMLERDELTLDASNTMQGAGSILSYLWTQVSGPPAQLSDPTSATPVMTAPTVSGAEETLVFELRVENSIGLSDTDRISVRAQSRTAPRRFIRMDGTSDDFITMGAEITITEDSGFFAQRRSADGRTVSFDLDTNVFAFQFDAPENEILAVGDYQNVAQAPFSGGRPGLNVSSNSQICIDVEGEFQVLVLDADRFAADFVQICNNDGSLVGEVRYNVVLPAADAGQDQVALERSPVTLDGTASSDTEGTIVGYEWSQISGAPVTLALDDPARPVFAAELGDGVLEEDLEFELTITDETGFRERDVVKVTVQQDNVPPVAVADSVSVGQGFAAEVDPIINDTDADGTVDPDSVEITGDPTEGTASFSSGTGLLRLRVDSGYVGTQVVSYSIRDNDGAESAAGRVTFEFTPGPVGLSDLATTDQDAPIEIDLLSNDQAADAPLDPASIQVLVGPRNGTLEIDGAGVALYTPAAGFSGSDSFEYVISDTMGRKSPIAFVTVNVKSTAPPPPPADTGGGADPAPAEEEAAQPVADSGQETSAPVAAAEESAPRLGRLGDVDAGGGAPHPFALLIGLLWVLRKNRLSR